MNRLTQRPLLLAAIIVVIFAVCVAGLLRVIPGPHTSSDYLVIGSLATLVTLVLLFAVVVGIAPGTFFRRK